MIGAGAELGPVGAVGAHGGLGLGGVDVAAGLLGQLLDLARGTRHDLWADKLLRLEFPALLPSGGTSRSPPSWLYVQDSTVLAVRSKGDAWDTNGVF